MRILETPASQQGRYAGSVVACLHMLASVLDVFLAFAHDHLLVVAKMLDVGSAPPRSLYCYSQPDANITLQPQSLMQAILLTP